MERTEVRDPDEFRGEPRKASRDEVVLRMNRIALALSAAHEELSELRHEIGIARRSEEPRRTPNFMAGADRD